MSKWHHRLTIGTVYHLSSKKMLIAEDCRTVFETARAKVKYIVEMKGMLLKLRPSPEMSQWLEQDSNRIFLHEMI
jgi:hypothetical protein